MKTRSAAAQDKAQYRLKKALGCQNLRFSQKDLAMFNDLARLGVLSAEQMAKHHYAKNSRPEDRINKLVEAGLLEKHVTYHARLGKVLAYTFPSQRVARVFSGFAPKIGNRTLRHEILVSEAYFAAGCPKDFKVASRFDESLYDKFHCQFQLGQRRPDYLRVMESVLPDAVFTNGAGELVVVEADAGGYDRGEVNRKMAGWKGHQQLWIQEKGAKAPVRNTSSVEVICAE